MCNYLEGSAMLLLVLWSECLLHIFLNRVSETSWSRACYCKPGQSLALIAYESNSQTSVQFWDTDPSTGPTTVGQFMVCTVVLHDSNLQSASSLINYRSLA